MGEGRREGGRCLVHIYIYIYNEIYMCFGILKRKGMNGGLREDVGREVQKLSSEGGGRASI